MNFFFVAIEGFIPISSNPISSNPILSNKRCRCTISSIFFWQIMVHLLFDYPIKPLDWSLERLVEGGCSIVCQPERVFRLLQDEFFDYFNGMFPVRMWNMYALEGPRTNNHAKDGIRKCGNWREKLIQTFMKQSLCSSPSKPPLKSASCSWQQEDCEKRLMTIREKYEAGDYSLTHDTKITDPCPR